MPSEATINHRVAAGTKELDSKVQGWWDKVSSAILDMYSHKDCVLGQVFESYFLGTLALKLNDDTAIYYGFDAENPSDKVEYEKLTNEWKRRLNGSNL